MNHESQSRIFLYEIIIQPQASPLGENKGQPYRQGKISLKVPYERMSQIMQQTARLGRKIISISPLTALENPKIQPDETLESNLSQSIELPWWVEILTAQPHCLYYFGPFESTDEAQAHQLGYLEDLQAEGAREITILIKQCQPQVLTQEW